MKKFKDLFLKNEILCKVLPELLKDQSTGKNIVWATDTYNEYGECYHKSHQMLCRTTLNLIYDEIMLPRVLKTKEEKKNRTKSKAEVFTPSWVCNKMNNHCDEEWFGRKDVFNIENDDHTWTVKKGKIAFGKQQNKRYAEWQRYVLSRRLEITCGEAPYLVSRYDTTTGDYIPIPHRIGILDRKLRVVNENTKTEEEWVKWATKAFESTYGFEYQGDSLFFARLNLLLTFIEYYEKRFKKESSKALVKKIVTIISWNLWQMDGLKNVPPFIPEKDCGQIALFEDDESKEPPYCKIRDWRNKKIVEYRNIKGNS